MRLQELLTGGVDGLELEPVLGDHRAEHLADAGGAREVAVLDAVDHRVDRVAEEVDSFDVAVREGQVLVVEQEVGRVLGGEREVEAGDLHRTGELEERGECAWDRR